MVYMCTSIAIYVHVSSDLSFVGVSPHSHLLIRGIKRTHLWIVITAFIGLPCALDFCFLRCEEFTVADGQAFDCYVHLAVRSVGGDVVVDSGLCLAGIFMNIKSSKTDHFWQGVINLIPWPNWGCPLPCCS